MQENTYLQGNILAKQTLSDLHQRSLQVLQQSRENAQVAKGVPVFPAPSSAKKVPAKVSPKEAEIGKSSTVLVEASPKVSGL